MGETQNVLILVAHRPGRSPGQRFRFEQYIGFLKQNGFQCTISYLINERDDQVFYKKGHTLRKFLIFIKSVVIRMKNLRQVRNFDLVFIYREAVMHGSVYFERKIKKKGVPFILDFDDAIWLFDVSDGNRKFGWLKRPEKTNEIIALSSLTIAGNAYLAGYAQRFGSHVISIPTTIDTERYVPMPELLQEDTVCIGWTGSSTTLKHFSLAIPVLKRLMLKYPGKLKIRLISDQPYQSDELDIEFCKWKADTETQDLAQCDIGIMPLPDDDWSRGKCGFKGLQYMALAIPAVMSPVGVNTEIIQDGVNGFLADSEEEWVEKLSMLIESEDLRKQLGRAGRNTVEERYSVHSNKQHWLHAFQSVVNGRS